MNTVPEKTVFYRPEIAALADWEAAVSLGVMFVERRDEWSWALGELASFMRTSKPSGGRPRASDKIGTLSAFADDIGLRRESLSAMCWNWEFFQDMRATLPENVTWHQLSEARRRSGWRPGMEIGAEHKERAAKFAEEYADEIPPRHKRTLADTLTDERDRLQAIAARPEAEPVRWILLTALKALDEAVAMFAEKTGG